MKRFVTTATGFALVLATFVTLGVAPSVSAESAIQAGVNAAHGNGQPTNLFGDTGVITTITNTLLFIAGALAVIMIIFGGIRYATSGGNAANVTAAKNTVLYAVVGLIVAFLAFAAVNWILGVMTVGTGGGYSNL